MGDTKHNLLKLVAALMFVVCGITGYASSSCKIRGMNYTGWNKLAYSTEASNQSLDELKNIGCDWVAINVIWFQDQIDSTLIEEDFYKYSVSAPSVVDAIQYCHSIGLKVMLKPMVDCRCGTWRGEFLPSAGWFNSYRNFMNFWADLAEMNNIEMLCIGCEYVKTVGWSASWRDIIQNVRDLYSGPLTYAANPGNETYIDWWDDLDYIGIDPYYPLTEELDPTPEQLETAWQGRADYLEDWVTTSWPNKEIIFTEIGYQSCNGTNQTPWRRDPQYYTVDLQEQVDCYKALLDVCEDRSWWRGVFWWNWETDPNEGVPGSSQHAWHTPQNKPAEALLKNYYVYCNGFSRGDLNHDTLVDINDLIILASQFLTNEPTCDLSPYPAGDGIINLADFAVFANNWKISLQSDINRDTHIDIEDLILLADQWLWTGVCGSIPEDIFEDGHVNLRDLAILAENWMSQ